MAETLHLSFPLFLFISNRLLLSIFNAKQVRILTRKFVLYSADAPDPLF